LIKELSGGMKRRIMIARALLHSPKILFLDEPTVGLDANIRKKIWALIKKIQQNKTTIFLTTHYIDEAEFLAQRVAFLNEGEITCLDSPINLIKKTGSWAIDKIKDADIETIYFKTKQEALEYNSNYCNSCNLNILSERSERSESLILRRVNLEDAFLVQNNKKFT